MKTLIIIPARLASSRLPNKVLADIGGYPMLWHVYHRCLQVPHIHAVHVATDSEEVAHQVHAWGGQAWITDAGCTSGTERIVSILGKLEGDLIVNVQGDQPFIEPQVIHDLIETFKTAHPTPDIITPVYPIEDNTIFSPQVVKVVLGHHHDALYFSRHPIPYVRDREPLHWSKSTPFWGHVGIYGYRRETLEQYHLLPESPLEVAEKLEQLRFLQAGKRILTFVTSHPPLSVDTLEDLEKVRALVQNSSGLSKT